jgi:hypothetical protein
LRDVVAEQRRQILSRAVQPHLDGGLRLRQHRGDLRSRALFDVAQDRDLAIALRQPLDARAHDGSRLLALQQLIGRDAPVRELFVVMAVVLAFTSGPGPGVRPLPMKYRGEPGAGRSA